MSKIPLTISSYANYCITKLTVSTWDRREKRFDLSRSRLIFSAVSFKEYSLFLHIRPNALE